MDCNIQFSSVTCRLCLSAPYTDLIEDVVKAEDIRHVLTLQYSLHDNLHPRHVCSTCTTNIDAFTARRDLALKNELILHVKESYSVSASPDQNFASDSETEWFHEFTESEMAVGRLRAS